MTASWLEWSYNPWRDRPGRAAVALVAALGCCLVATSLRLPGIPTLILCVVCVATLAAGFVPVRCRLDDHGVVRRSGWFAERRPWDQLRRAVRRRDGLWLSPYSHHHWLDPYRALFLPFPQGTAASLAEALDPILSSHGLETPLAPEDLALLDRLARRVVELHLELPAILTLETGKPLSLLAGQTLVFFEPLVQSVFSFPDYRRFALLIERRAAIEALIHGIERRADEARVARRTPKAETPPGPPAA